MGEFHTKQWIVMDKPGVELYHSLFTFRAFEEDGQYVSVCDELEVASCGDSAIEAIENVIEATCAYLDTIEGLGERKQVFAERGIEFDRGAPPNTRPQPQAVPLQANELVTRRLLAPIG